MRIYILCLLLCNSPHLFCMLRIPRRLTRFKTIQSKHFSQKVLMHTDQDQNQLKEAYEHIHACQQYIKDLEHKLDTQERLHGVEINQYRNYGFILVMIGSFVGSEVSLYIKEKK